MSEAVGDDGAARLPLQPIIANGGRGRHRLLQVILVQIVVPRLHLVRPHAGQAIGHQLGLDRYRIALIRVLLFRRLNFRQQPHQVLHVMADLVRDHVGIGKVTTAAQLGLHILEESCVEVEFMVIGTIEWPHRRLGGATPGLGRTREQHEDGLLILPIGLLRQFLSPDVFSLAQNA